MTNYTNHARRVWRRLEALEEHMNEYANEHTGGGPRLLIATPEQWENMGDDLQELWCKAARRRKSIIIIMDK